jgi:membrane associated rhomboid family serine protease
MKAQFFPYHDENPSRTVPYLTYSLILINTVVFLTSLFDFENIIYTYGFTPIQMVPITILTSMFLHGGIDHLFGNMWYLYIFGDNVEDRLGRTKYIIFYLAAGLTATIFHLATNLGSVIPAIGASGAISGILGAYLAIFPRVKVRAIGFYTLWRLPAWVIIVFWFVLQLIFGTISFVGGQGSGIAFWAHIGGFVFGFLAGKIYSERNKNSKTVERKPTPTTQKYY